MIERKLFYVVVGLLVLAACSILVAAACRYIHPFAGGVLAGWLSGAAALVGVVLWKHRDK